MWVPCWILRQFSNFRLRSKEDAIISLSREYHRVLAWDHSNGPNLTSWGQTPTKVMQQAQPDTYKLWPTGSGRYMVSTTCWLKHIPCNIHLVPWGTVVFQLRITFPLHSTSTFLVQILQDLQFSTVNTRIKFPGVCKVTAWSPKEKEVISTSPVRKLQPVALTDETSMTWEYQKTVNQHVTLPKPKMICFHPLQFFDYPKANSA